MAANQTTGDYLRVLGLKEGSSADEIKKAYKSLALQHHPDKNHDDPDATEKFQKVSEAYTYLMKEEEDDEDQGEFFEDDITLISLLRLFARLSKSGPGDRCNCASCGRFRPSSTLSGGARIVVTPYGIGIFDDDDDDDYHVYGDGYRNRPKARSASDRYQFTCEDGYGDSGRSRNKAGRTTKRTVLAGREPSKKWMRKQMKREYNSCRSDEEKEFKAGDEEDLYWEKDPRDKQKEEKPKEAKKKDDKKETVKDKAPPDVPKTDQNNNSKSKKDSKPEKPPAPKKLTKKQLAAEQRRREREMAQIAEDLEKEKQKEVEKEQKRQEKERARQEELKKTVTAPLKNYQKGKDQDFDSELKQRLIDSQKEEMKRMEIMRENAPKKKESKKKKRQQKKDSNFVPDEAGVSSSLPEQPTRGVDEWLGGNKGKTDDISSGWIEESQAKSSDNAGNNDVVVLKHIGESQKRGTPARGVSSARDSPRVYNTKSFTASTYSTKEDRTETMTGGKTFTIGSSSGGISRNRDSAYKKFVPPRMQENPNLQPAESKAVGQSPVSPWSQATSFPQSSQLDQTDTTRSHPPSGSAWNSNPPPRSTQNVWQQRQEFYQGALPSNEMEERAMLEAALQMSKLQAKEEELKNSIEEEEYNIKLAEQEMKRKNMEKKRQEDMDAMRDKFCGLQTQSNQPNPPPLFAAAVGTKPRTGQSLHPNKNLSESPSQDGFDMGMPNLKSRPVEAPTSSQPVQQMSAQSNTISSTAFQSKPAAQPNDSVFPNNDGPAPKWPNFVRLPKTAWPPTGSGSPVPEIPRLPGSAPSSQPATRFTGGFGGAKPKTPVLPVISAPVASEENWEDDLMDIPVPTPIARPHAGVNQDEVEQSSSSEYETDSEESGTDSDSSSEEQTEEEECGASPSPSKAPPGLDVDLAADPLPPGRTNPVGTVKPTIHPSLVTVNPPGPDGEPGLAQPQASNLSNLFGYSNTWPMMNFGSLPYFAGPVPMVPSYPGCHASQGTAPQVDPTARGTPAGPTAVYSPAPTPSIPGLPAMMPGAIPVLPGMMPMMGMPFINPQVLQAYQASLASQGLSPLGRPTQGGLHLPGAKPTQGGGEDSAQSAK